MPKFWIERYFGISSCTFPISFGERFMKNLQKININTWHNSKCDSVARFGRLHTCHLQLRAGLHYIEEVHRLVKSSNPRRSYLRRRLVLADKMEKRKKKTSSWSSWRFKFRVWGLEVAQETFNKKCCHVGNHVIFSFMLEILHRGSLGCSVNPN